MPSVKDERPSKRDKTKDFISTVRSVAADFCVHSPPGGQSVKILNNGVVPPYPSRSVV